MDERTRILKLVESGTITAEEGISLLEALSKEQAPQKSQQPVQQTSEPVSVEPKQQATGEDKEQSQTFGEQDEQQKRTTGFEDIFGNMFNNKKMEQVFHDIRSDVTEFSDRMMTFMNTTLSRVKSGEVPFGEKIEFEQSFAYPSEDIQAFEIDIPNGKIDFVQSEEQQVVVTAFVKTPTINKDGIDVKKQFLEGFVESKDGKLDISTSSKLAYVELKITVPRKLYDVIIVKLLSGAVSFSGIDAKLLKTKTYNGNISYYDGRFEHADLQTVNGSIEVNAVDGADLEANTANGRIYIDGKLKEIDAESVNGHVVVTTTSSEAHKLKANTLAGSVELYIPKTVSLEGTAASNFGKVDVQLDGARVKAEEEQFLRKMIYFNKITEDAKLLKVHAESRTGSVIIRYTGLAE